MVKCPHTGLIIDYLTLQTLLHPPYFDFVSIEEEENGVIFLGVLPFWLHFCNFDRENSRFGSTPRILLSIIDPTHNWLLAPAPPSVETPGTGWEVSKGKKEDIMIVRILAGLDSNQIGG